MINSLIACENDPRKAFEGNRDCYLFTEVIEGNYYLECYDVCFFGKPLLGDSDCYYLTDSINFQKYLGHKPEHGDIAINTTTEYIVVELNHPRSSYISTRDTYYFKDLVKLNNYKK